MVVETYEKFQKQPTLYFIEFLHESSSSMWVSLIQIRQVYQYSSKHIAFLCEEKSKNNKKTSYKLPSWDTFEFICFVECNVYLLYIHITYIPTATTIMITALAIVIKSTTTSLTTTTVTTKILYHQHKTKQAIVAMW